MTRRRPKTPIEKKRDAARRHLDGILKEHDFSEFAELPPMEDWERRVVTAEPWEIIPELEFVHELDPRLWRATLAGDVYKLRKLLDHLSAEIDTKK